MSIQNPLPIPVVQMGHVEKMAEQAQNQPQVQQQITQEEAKRTLEKQRSQIERTDKPRKSDQATISKDGRQKQQHEQQHKQSAQQQEETSEPEECKPPFTGCILNIKV